MIISRQYFFDWIAVCSRRLQFAICDQESTRPTIACRAAGGPADAECYSERPAVLRSVVLARHGKNRWHFRRLRARPRSWPGIYISAAPHHLQFYRSRTSAIQGGDRWAPTASGRPIFSLLTRQSKTCDSYKSEPGRCHWWFILCRQSTGPESADAELVPPRISVRHSRAVDQRGRGFWEGQPAGNCEEVAQIQLAHKRDQECGFLTNRDRGDEDDRGNLSAESGDASCWGCSGSRAGDRSPDGSHRCTLSRKPCLA